MDPISCVEGFPCPYHDKSWLLHSSHELWQDFVDRCLIPRSAFNRLREDLGEDDLLVQSKATRCRAVQGFRLWLQLKSLSPDEEKAHYLHRQEWDVGGLREDIHITKNRKVIPRKKI